MTDHLRKYLFADTTVRAQAVSLRNTWQQVTARHDYPPAIQRVLGELVAASTLLSANLKFDGVLALQLQGDGPVALAVVECHADLGLRATVKLREGETVGDDDDFQALFNPNGKGRFIVVLDPQDKHPGQQPYQGIVALEGETVAEVLEHYMATSEQLQTRLWLAADGDCAAGLLLQQLPRHGGKTVVETESEQDGEVDDTWNRALQLAATIKPEELTELPPEKLIHRLYWQETMTAFDPLTVSYRCNCSRERVAQVLLMLGREEVDSIVEEQGKASVSCDYCVKTYEFDSVDCAELFANHSPTVRHHSDLKH